MLFDDKKIEVESINELLQCSVESVEPYALMLAPVYVYMKLNEKLVSVKAPLDFFTPEELKNFRRYECFYIPKFAKSATRFQTAAKVIRNLLKKSKSESFGPAPYEISNEVIQMMGPLWGKDLRVESFFAAVFADELLGPLSPEKMLQARELAVVRHDRGILLSGALVFILIQLGWFDLELLHEIRNQTYIRTAEGEEWKNPNHIWECINSDLYSLIEMDRPIEREALKYSNSEWAKKIVGRLSRIEKLPTTKEYDSLTIYGAEGFAI